MKAQQRGISLIELLIGLTISMVVVLAMLIVYKNSVAKAVEAGKGATHDGQRIAALFSAQSGLQGAGFGIPGAAYGTDLILIKDASLSLNQLSGTAASSLPATSSTTGSNALVWGSNISGTYQCTALYAPASGGLQRLTPQNCTNAAAWSSLTWAGSTTLVEATAPNAVSISVKAVGTGQTCAAFGITGAGSLIATLTTKYSTAQDTNSSVCLANFPL